MSVFNLSTVLSTGTNANNGTTDNASNQAHDQAPNIAAPNIASAAMLVEVTLRRWSGQKKDKRATEEMLRSNDASEGAAAVTKFLMGTGKNKCPELQAVDSFLNAVRTYVYNATMPWSDMGGRLLTTQRYFKFHEDITAFQQQLDTLLDPFIEAYEWRLNEAEADRAGLGRMFNRDDFPSPDEVRRRFAIVVSYSPLPEAGDWRVDIGNYGNQVLKDHYEQYFASRVDQMRGEVYERFSKKVGTLINAMDWTAGEKPKRMYETTFDAVCEMIDDLEEFNLTGDTTMAELRKQLASVMDGVTLEALKTDHALRATKKQQLEQAIKALPSLDW